MSRNSNNEWADYALAQITGDKRENFKNCVSQLIAHTEAKEIANSAPFVTSQAHRNFMRELALIVREQLLSINGDREFWVCKGALFVKNEKT